MSSFREVLKSARVRIAIFIASNKFFALIVSWLVVQAGWIAVSGAYPMAFDEDTHLGIINYFSHHGNLFFSQQPASLNQYGAVVRDPSYLYRYLMVLPWRIITRLTDDFTIQVICLRFVNIALFVAGLFLIRRLLLKATESKLIVNVVLLLFILTPITSQLAAQINYDNLLIPLMAASLLIALKIIDKFKNKQIDLWLITWFIVLATAASLTKFTYLTILLPTIAYLSWQFIKSFKRQKTTIWHKISKAYRKLSKPIAITMVAIVLICTGLLAERYGVNLIKYHSLTPSCAKVLNEQSCQQNSIYRRGVDYQNSKPQAIDKNPALFTYRWAKHMNYNLMMNLSGPAIGYSVGQPLPLPYIASIIFAIGGLILCIFYARRIFNNPAMILLLYGTVFYLATLWLNNYASYIDTGRRVAIQGRYLVPLLPFIYLSFVLAYRLLLNRWKLLGSSLLTLLVICFFLGGGVFTFILHSDNSWYWTNNQAVSRANYDAKKVIRYIVPGWGTDYNPYWQSSFSF